MDHLELCDDPDCRRRHPWGSWGESTPASDDQADPGRFARLWWRRLHQALEHRAARA